MKNLLFLLVLAVMSSTFAFAQKVTVKAGTPVSLQVVNPVKAADLEVGQKVLFRVSRDINVKGVTAIPYGTIVHGSVYEAKRSKWFGTKGRLGININEIVTSDGTVVPLTNGDIYVTGQNRTALAVVVFLFTLVPLPCGSKAHLPNGYEIVANVATTITLDAETE